MKSSAAETLHKAKLRIKARPKNKLLRAPRGIPKAEALYLKIATKIGKEIEQAALESFDGVIITEEFPIQGQLRVRTEDATIDYKRYLERMERYRQRILEITDKSRLVGFLREVARQASSSNAFDIAQVLGIRPPELETGLLQSWIEENVRQIDRISARQATRIEEVLQRATDEGVRHETIVQDIQQASGKSVTQARLIARDQTLTINADLTETRHKNLGIHRYKFGDSRDSRVRSHHARLGDRSRAGEVFEYDNPPMGGGTTEREAGNPGQGILCRCLAYPELD